MPLLVEHIVDQHIMGGSIFKLLSFFNGGWFYLSYKYQIMGAYHPSPESTIKGSNSPHWMLEVFKYSTRIVLLRLELDMKASLAEEFVLEF